jgi:hypothetical protein
MVQNIIILCIVSKKAIRMNAHAKVYPAVLPEMTFK